MPAEILVIREKDHFSSILIERGFPVINFPVIKTEPLMDLSELENCLAEIETFDGIFVTSSKATEIVLAKLSEMQKDFRGKFFVFGKRSAKLLKNAGYETFFNQRATTAKEFLELIPKEELKNKRFLFPCGNRSLRVVPETLGNVAHVREVIVYRTLNRETDEKTFVEIKEKFEGGKIAAVCFFSPSGIEGFLGKFENFAQNNSKVAVIGKTTARSAVDNNLRVDFVSAKSSVTDFAVQLVDFFNLSLKG